MNKSIVGVALFGLLDVTASANVQIFSPDNDAQTFSRQ